jgi:hypothetical protein
MATNVESTIGPSSADLMKYLDLFARFSSYSDDTEPMFKNGAVGADDTPEFPKGLNGPTGPMIHQAPVTLNMLNHARQENVRVYVDGV